MPPEDVPPLDFELLLDEDPPLDFELLLDEDPPLDFELLPEEVPPELDTLLTADFTDDETDFAALLTFDFALENKPILNHLIELK